VAQAVLIAVVPAVALGAAAVVRVAAQGVQVAPAVSVAARVLQVAHRLAAAKAAAVAVVKALKVPSGAVAANAVVAKGVSSVGKSLTKCSKRRRSAMCAFAPVTAQRSDCVAVPH
jgi:hypothetical protein